MRLFEFVPKLFMNFLKKGTQIRGASFIGMHKWQRHSLDTRKTTKLVSFGLTCSKWSSCQTRTGWRTCNEPSSMPTSQEPSQPHTSQFTVFCLLWLVVFFYLWFNIFLIKRTVTREFFNTSLMQSGRYSNKNRLCHTIHFYDRTVDVDQFILSSLENLFSLSINTCASMSISKSVVRKAHFVLICFRTGKLNLNTFGNGNNLWNMY